MKNLLFILLIVSLESFGQSITITPNNSALFDAKGTSNQLLLKNDTLKLSNAVFKVSNSIGTTDQQQILINSYDTGTPSLQFQTFKAGVSGKLTQVKFAIYNPDDLTPTLKIYQGAGTGGTLLGSKTFTTVNAWNTVVLTLPILLSKGQTYTIALENITSWAYHSGDVYADGYASIGAANDFSFQTILSLDYGLLINSSGDVCAGRKFIGDGSELTLSSYLTAQGNAFNGINQLVQTDLTGKLVSAVLPTNLTLQGNTFNGASQLVRLNAIGNLGIGTNTPTQRLDVAGNVRGTSFINSSDIRFKKDFSKIEKPLDKLLSINGLYYHWQKEEFPNRGFDEAKQVGFIAQDLEKIFPEVVFTDASGFKSVDYPKLTPLLVEAIKELKKENDFFKKELETFKNLLLQIQNGK